MATLKKYDLNGKALAEVELEEALLEVEECSQLIKDAIVALRKNRRQWSANTKGRSEVSHSNQKPHRQKGTGRARQGSLASPQYRGGGVVFGPKPKFDQHVRINQKERKKAVLAMYAQKAKEGNLLLLEDAAFTSALEKPKTAKVANFLNKIGINNKRVLFVAPPKNETSDQGRQSFFRSVKNLPKAEVALMANVNSYDLTKAASVVVSEAAFDYVKGLLAQEGKKR